MRSLKIYISIGVLAALGLSSCSDQFLEDKKNYDNLTKDVYNYYSGAKARLNDIYSQCLPWMTEMAGAESNKRFTGVSTGLPDMASQSTEEYAGTWSDFVNPNVTLTGGATGTAVPDFFMGKVTDIQQSAYGRVRNVNDFIAGVEGSTLSEAQKNELLGQAHFFRAWLYFNMVKWYGGVPLVTEVQIPEKGVFTPRSNARQCFQFIFDELNTAASQLSATTNGGWTGSDWGRVTAGTALALKGRALMLWASPLFNRKGEDRWTSAYQEMKNDLSTINACGYDLFKTSNNINGSDFALQFMQLGKNPEAVFVTLHNSITTKSDEQQNNPWEAKIRPKNTAGSGLAASYTLVNLFPDKNGIIVPGTGTYTKLKTSGTYDKNYPFVDRDPRFYRTFAFPGVKWVYSGDPTKKDPNNPSYGNGKNYVLWNYVWYTVDDDTKRDDPTGSDAARAADNFLTSKSSIYVRKKSDDGGIKGATQMYTYMSDYDQPFKTSAAPVIELRYAEVLLNLAEAACMAGDVEGALGYMNKVRARAGVRALTTGDFIGDTKSACMSAILYERQIEFAYEGKRFYDMRRWMLFDGGAVKPANTPDTYTLTGFGGNTCTWLGVTPWNGQRRERIEFQTAKRYGAGGITFDSDPLLKAGTARDVIVDLDDATTDLSTQTANLKTWYQNNLYIVEKNSDPLDAAKNKEVITFNPKYYILGLKNSVQENNKDIPQTVGWEVSSGGAFGTFDPLAE